MKTFLEKHCTPEWQEFIKFHSKELTFKKNTHIFKCQEDTEGLFIINSGLVKISYRQFNGTMKLVRLAKDGDILGHRGFGGNWKYPVEAKSYTQTVITFIPLTIFNIVAKADTNFLFNLMMFYANELRKSDQRMKNLPIINALANALAYNLEVFGFDKKSQTKLHFTIPRKDLASYVGTTYETIIRKLAELNEDKIIKIDGKSIHILDVKRLNALANPKFME